MACHVIGQEFVQPTVEYLFRRHLIQFDVGFAHEFVRFALCTVQPRQRSQIVTQCAMTKGQRTRETIVQHQKFNVLKESSVFLRKMELKEVLGQLNWL